MLKKISITLSFVFMVAVLPSYTNTCAKPGAAFLKADSQDPTCTVAEPQRVKSTRAEYGLEVFPLELISIQL
jgi:hypothetical protein